MKTTTTGMVLLFIIFSNCSSKIEEDQELPQSTHPVWSPDGTQIAFINNKIGVENKNSINFEVFTMNADGSNKVRRTFNTAFESDISWSPNGDKLAVKSYRDENDEVYIIDLKTGNQTNISNSTEREGDPTWSKNGSTIYFQSDRDNEKGELYEYSIDSTTIKRITHNNFSEYGAIRSPDQQKIAFVSNRDGDDDIYIMNVTDSSVTQLTNNELNDWYPQWSPEGEKLLFTYGDWETDIWELRIINTDGTGQETLIKQVDSGNASWHKDGNKIAFGSARLGAGEIFIFNMETKKEVQVTNNLIEDFQN